MNNDPYLALLEMRGEYLPEDEDELDSLYDSGNHLTKTYEYRSESVEHEQQP